MSLMAHHFTCGTRTTPGKALLLIAARRRDNQMESMSGKQRQQIIQKQSPGWRRPKVIRLSIKQPFAPGQL